MSEIEKAKEKESKSGIFWIPVSIIIAGFLIAAAVVFSNSIKNPDAIKGSAEEYLPEQEERPAPGSEFVNVSKDDDPSTGPENAAVEIIEFSDFECPYCTRHSDTMKKIKAEYGDKVSITFRDYPLEFHQHAHVAAQAAECADDQKKFWEFHDLLFASKEELNKENIKKYAKDLGLDTNIFNSCLDTEKYKDEVDKDIKDGVEAGITGTPATFVNGRKVIGAQAYEVFKGIIDKELEN